MAKVLIVDDNPDFRNSTRDLLEAEGFDVVLAENGKTAVEMAERDKPDVILLDVMMTHDTEGFDTAKELNKSANTRDIPIIMITGIRKEKTLPFSFEPDDEWLPVKTVLEKPVNPEMLLKEIKKHV